MRPITFDQTKAKKLYLKLKSDAEIGKALNVPPSTIKSWRQRERLKDIAVKKNTKRYHKPKKRKNYADVLPFEQAIEMNKFLKTLSRVGRIAVKAGVKPDVGKLMNAWRGEVPREGVS